MIFVFSEDGTLEVLDGVPDATRRCEGIDVESGVFRFYDQNGAPLQARFSVPNRRGRFLGLFPWISSGVFDLVPEPVGVGDSFALSLAECVALAPNRFFKSLQELRDSLRARGVEVDHR